jgi:hypothetical protein
MNANLDFREIKLIVTTIAYSGDDYSSRTQKVELSQGVSPESESIVRSWRILKLGGSSPEISEWQSETLRCNDEL